MSKFFATCNFCLFVFWIFSTRSLVISAHSGADSWLWIILPIGLGFWSLYRAMWWLVEAIKEGMTEVLDAKTSG